MNGHPELKGASSQRGFAEFVDCSPSLIRAVEQGISKITPKLVNKVHAMTGVSRSWLSALREPNQPIPAETGVTLTHEAVMARWKEEIQRNIMKAEESLMVRSKALADSSGNSQDPALSMRRQMAAAMAKLVEQALFDSMNRGDNGLMDEITRILTRGTRGSPVPGQSGMAPDGLNRAAESAGVSPVGTEVFH